MENERKYRPLFTSDYDGFINKLKQARKDAELTQEEVDDKLKIYHSFTRRCETKQRRVDFIECLKFAIIYGKQPSYFILDVDIELEKN